MKFGSNRTSNSTFKTLGKASNRMEGKSLSGIKRDAAKMNRDSAESPSLAPTFKKSKSKGKVKLAAAKPSRNLPLNKFKAFIKG